MPSSRPGGVNPLPANAPRASRSASTSASPAWLWCWPFGASGRDNPRHRRGDPQHRRGRFPLGIFVADLLSHLTVHAKTFQQSRTESHDRRQHRGPQRAGDPAPAPRPARVVARGTDSERLEDLECLRGAYQSLPEFSSLTGITADGPPAEVLFRLQAALAAASGRRDGESAPGNPADTGSHSGSQRSATPMAAPGPSRYN